MTKAISFKNNLNIFAFLYTLLISTVIFINFSTFTNTTKSFRYFLEQTNSIQNLNNTILKFEKLRKETLFIKQNLDKNSLVLQQKKLKEISFITSQQIRRNKLLIENIEIKNNFIIQEYLEKLMYLEENITTFIYNIDIYVNSQLINNKINPPLITTSSSLDNLLLTLNTSYKNIYQALLTESETNILQQKVTLFFTNLLFILLSIFFFRLYKTHILKETIIQNKNTLLKNINQKLINKLEEDRNEISQIIHNNLGQYLIAINLDLIALRNNLTKKDIQEKITTCIGLIKDSLGSLKETTSFISAPHILTLDFQDAIKMHCKNFQNHYICKLNLIYKISKYDLNKEKKLVLFRCIQEGLNNIAKHSKANKIYIKLLKNKSHLYLGIRDNGSGLSNDYIPSLGHTSLEQRVLSLSGQFKIKNNFNSKGISMLIKI